MIGDIVTVTVDRPLGSFHPEYKDMYYPVNYGYIEGIMAPDGEEQDAYILGVSEPVEKFTGRIIAVVHRADDVEEKWVVCPEGMTFTAEEIMEQIRFQEQYYQSEIIMGLCENRKECMNRGISGNSGNRRENRRARQAADDLSHQPQDQSRDRSADQL